MDKEWTMAVPVHGFMASGKFTQAFKKCDKIFTEQWNASQDDNKKTLGQFHDDYVAYLNESHNAVWDPIMDEVIFKTEADFTMFLLKFS